MCVARCGGRCLARRRAARGDAAQGYQGYDDAASCGRRSVLACSAVAATAASRRKIPSDQTLSRASCACRRCRAPPPTMPRTRWSGELSQVYSPEVDAASDLAHRWVRSRAASRMLARWRCGRSSMGTAGGRSRGVRLHRRLTTFAARTRVVSGGRVHGPTDRADGRSQLRQIGSPATSTCTALRATHQKGGGCSARRLLPRAATQASFADAGLTRYGKAHGY
ncbi:hypothetical protein T492DRAFT_961227 [Pavlovales sp. CCMP2436]|nr:hypothetical protein T492DRAFT_961227 [Pavlovales sp. CCMP2436]